MLSQRNSPEKIKLNFGDRNLRSNENTKRNELCKLEISPSFSLRSVYLIESTDGKALHGPQMGSLAEIAARNELKIVLESPL